MEWSPDVDTISQVLFMLQALRDPTCPTHKEALDALSSETINPSFVLHLVHIFSRGGSYDGIPPDIRQLAGLITKNYVFPRLAELTENVFDVVKHEIINGLGDPVASIRNTAGLLVGRITDMFMMDYWVDILEFLLGGALQMPDDISELQGGASSSAAAARIDGSLVAVKRMCEDAAEKLFLDTQRRPLEALVPQLLALLASPVGSHRIKAIESISALIYLIPPSEPKDIGSGATPCALITYMNAILAALSQMSADPDAYIRRAVCHTLVLLTSFQLAVLVPMLPEICQFMLQNISDEDENVAMEACEFWLEFLRNAEASHFLLQEHDACGESSVISTLIPALVSRFVLTTEQIELDREEDEATASGEREVNFKPIHHKSSGWKNEYESDEEEGEEEEEESGGGGSGWTLRRSAAKVLDSLACCVPPPVTLAVALPVVQATFSHPDVWVFETGMLALGALSHGCSEDMAQFLPDLLPILLSTTEGRREVEAEGEQVQVLPTEVQCIACWVLGRFSEFWFTEGGDDEYGFGGGGKSVEEQKAILEHLMVTMLDSSPRLQASSCSALTQVFESVAASEYEGSDDVSLSILEACLGDMVLQFHRAFGIFGVKNKLILCDTIGTLFDSIPPKSLQSLSSPSESNLSGLVLDPLLQNFYQTIQMIDPLSDGSCFLPHQNLFPIMECLTSACNSVGLDLIPSSVDLVKTLLQLIASVLDEHDKLDAEEHSADVELPNIDFAVCSLDVISAVVEALHTLFPVVVLSRPPSAADLELLPATSSSSSLLSCCEHGLGQQMQEALVYQLLRCLSCERYPDIRQSAFSLLGDLISLADSASLFSSPLATSIASAVSHLAPRDEMVVDFLSSSYMSLCSSGPTEEGSDFFLTPCVLYILQLSFCQLNPAAVSQCPLVANNAVWVVGEYFLAMGHHPLISQLMQPFAYQIAELLQYVIVPDGTSAKSIQAFSHKENSCPRALKQNLAIALGRLVYLSPEAATSAPSPLLTSPHGISLQCFCYACSIIELSDTDSREHAFIGLIAALNVNPQALLQNPNVIEQFVIACNSWRAAPYDTNIFSGLRDVLLACASTPSWKGIMKKNDGGARLYDLFKLS